MSSIILTALAGPPPNYKVSDDTPNLGKIEITPKVGLETCFLGLFTQDDGGERNLPIARFGNISRPPGTSTEWLVEFNVWGGNSGSPVFVFEPKTIHSIKEIDGVDRVISIDTAQVCGLLGLVNAYYVQEENAGNDLRLRLNSGMAMVTSAHIIKELLMSDVVVQDRLAKNPPPRS